MLDGFVTLPDIFESFGDDLGTSWLIGMASITGKDHLVLIALVGEDASHALMGDDRVVHVTVQDSGAVGVPVTDLKPDAQGELGIRVSWNPHAPCGVASECGHCWLA